MDVENPTSAFQLEVADPVGHVRYIFQHLLTSLIRGIAWKFRQIFLRLEIIFGDFYLQTEANVPIVLDKNLRRR